jgi:type I restriction enzyme M protein
MKQQRNRDGASSTVTLGYEAQLWRMADALRGCMDAAEYKHDVKPFNICYGET